MLGHLGPRRPRHGGRLVRQQRRLPESVEPNDVLAFLADLGTHRERAIVLLMVFGGLRAGEVRSLHLADVDQGQRRVRVVSKGGGERTVPIDRAFFSELAAYLRFERPPGLSTPECFVVLRGPTAGRPMTEAGMRASSATTARPRGGTRSVRIGYATRTEPSGGCGDRSAGAARVDGPTCNGRHRDALRQALPGRTRRLVCLGCGHAQPKKSAVPIFRRMLASHRRTLGAASR